MDTSELFDHLSLKIGQLLYRRSLGDRSAICKTLDDLNSLNYRYPFVKSSTKAVLLINQCCTSVHPDDDVLVLKCAQLITNLVTNQSVCVEGRTLMVSIQWCLQSIKNVNRNVVLEVLKALEALIRNNVHNISSHLESITNEIKNEVEIETSAKKSQISQDILLIAFRCLEASTVIPLNAENVDSLNPHLERCSKMFISYLCVKRSTRDILAEAKILETCLVGLQNIVRAHPEYLKKELGLILGIVKSYMLYNIKDVEFLSAEKLMPTTLSIPEISLTFVKEKTGGKVTKQRKHRTAGSNKKKDKKNNEDGHFEKSNGTYLPATTSLDYNSDSGLLNMSNSRLKMSDSDFSDNEGGKLAKLSHCCNKVRQASLNLFAVSVKNTEKAVIFTYWSSFVPESSSLGKHNLLTCILKDPSTRGKMCALNALLLLLTSTKAYLAQAESSEKTSSFTPFCVLLGLTLIELHKTLCLALNQSSVPVLVQVLKCLAALVQATPYHRMSSGLITKVVRNVKPLVSHRDASVQVTALIVMGCILALEPPIPETRQVVTKVQKEGNLTLDKMTVNSQTNAELETCTASSISTYDDFDYALFSSDEDEEPAILEVDSMPWLLIRCLVNLGVSFQDSQRKDTIERIVAAPVKLESLQVLSAMSRNYFESLILPHLNYIVKALEISLMDKYIDLKLHAGRAIDFLGQAMCKIGESEVSTIFLSFWQTLLNGPLVSLIQNDEHAALRAVGCDCLGSIGPDIFQQFPREKQILCVTLLFACTKDDENIVKGAAVRALAICVLYPSLRGDPGFVEDTAEAVLQALNDENFNVRVKASWSLGNLSDALALNSKTYDSFEDRIPEKILLKLLNASTRNSNDNEKVKMNAVRAVGNLIQLLDTDLLKQEQFKDATLQALNVLVKASTTGSNMKVRWNACYALGNALKNQFLYEVLDANTWQSTAFSKLADLVVGFKNFKVRINAALALSSPAKREHYGQFFIPTWSALLQGLENSQNMEDFTEYKHRDHLVEQICLSLGHMTTLLTREDLPHLQNILNLYLETFRSHVHKVVERLVPEKSAELFSASCYLISLESRSDINGVTEKQVIACLKTVFVTQW